MEAIESAIKLIAGLIVIAGTSGIGLYYAFRKNKTSADEADGKVLRAARKENMGIDSEALYKVIDTLTTDNVKLRESIMTLQNSTLVKIIDAHDEHYECEKKYATLEVKFELSEKRALEFETRLKQIEGHK